MKARLVIVGAVLLAMSNAAAGETDRRRLTDDELRRFRLPKEAARLTIDTLKRAKVIPPDYKPRSGMSLPLYFEENRGQADSSTRFVVRHRLYAARFTAKEILIGVSGTEKNGGEVFRMSFDAARAIEPKGQLSSKATINVMRGADKKKWQLGVPLYKGLMYRGIYDDVDLVFDGRDGSLAYGFLLGGKGDPDRIRLRMTGARSLKLNSRGDLFVQLGGGMILHTRFTARERTAKGSRDLKVEFVIAGRDVIGFKLHGRTPGSAVAIHPEIVFSSYFGGSGREGTLGVDQGAAVTARQGVDVSHTGSGMLFISGRTSSPDFPATIGQFRANFDGFVLKLNAASAPPELVWASVFGGLGGDAASGITALPDGSSFVCGTTMSSDFPPPSQGAVHSARPDGGAYVVRLTSEGVIDRGTLIGSTASFVANAVASDPETHEVVVAGTVTGAPQSGLADTSHNARQRTLGGLADGFVAKFDTTISHPRYVTYLGGKSFDTIMAVALRNRVAYVTGSTSSMDFPHSESAHQEEHSMTAAECGDGNSTAGCFDIFAAAVNDDGSDLVYSTFYGGPGDDYARAIVVDSSRTAHITGATADGSPVAVIVLSVSRLGDSIHDEARMWFRVPGDRGEDIALDANGNAHIIGTIVPGDPSLGATDILTARRTVPFLEEVQTWGGSSRDAGFGIAIDEHCMYIVGETESVDLYPVSEIQATNAGGGDLYIAAYCTSTLPIVYKTVDDSETVPNWEITFTIMVHNNTGAPLNGRFVDDLPAGLEFVRLYEGFAPACASAPPVDCNVTIPEGPTYTKLKAVVTSDCPAVLTNVARVIVNGTAVEFPVSVIVNCPPGPLGLETCGNNVWEHHEKCDDGNRNNCDGCSDKCKREICGDGKVDACEECDPMNDALCNASCQRFTARDELCTPGTTRCEAGTTCDRQCWAYEDDHCMPLLGWFCNSGSICEEYTCR